MTRLGVWGVVRRHVDALARTESVGACLSAIWTRNRGGTARTQDDLVDGHMLYHMVVSRREVLVQLDDELVERLDRLARAENTSRSELLRRGAAAVIEAAEQIDADRILQEAYRRVPQDPALVASARRLAAETAPAW